MTPRRTIRRAGSLAGAVGFAVAATACGAGDAAGRFDDEVSEVRAAVEAGDRERAREALDVLALDALAAHEEGELDEAELREVADLIAAAGHSVDELTTETTSATTEPTTTTTTPPPVSEEPSDDDDDDGKGKGRGKKDNDD